VANLTLLAIVLCAPPPVEDGPNDDPDWVAPYLGLSVLDAEALQLDAEASPERAALLPRAAPFWARWLPDLSMALQVRTAKKRVLATGAVSENLRDGLIFLVLASFPLSEEPRPEESILAALASHRGAAPVSDQWQEAVPEAAGALAGPGEPTVQELQLAAERASVTPVGDLAGWRGRARASALLPELTLDYRRNVGEIDTLGIRSDLGIDSHHIEDITRYGARATWQLSQILFNREEVTAAQAADAIERNRRELLLEVARLSFRRQAMQRELLGRPAPEPARRSQLSLDIAQTGAELDALTGGYLSKQLARETP
jgi:hypothetical protein